MPANILLWRLDNLQTILTKMSQIIAHFHPEPWKLLSFFYLCQRGLAWSKLHPFHSLVLFQGAFLSLPKPPLFAMNIPIQGPSRMGLPMCWVLSRSGLCKVRKENVVKRMRGGSRERMKKRQIQRGNIEKLQEKETGKGIKRHRTNLGKWKNRKQQGRIESNREDSFYPVSFFL